jgi:hypothetical protein
MNVKLIGPLFRRFFENIVFFIQHLNSGDLKSDELKCDDWTVEIPISEIGSKLASTSKRRGKGEKERKKDERLVFADPKNDCEKKISRCCYFFFILDLFRSPYKSLNTMQVNFISRLFSKSTLPFGGITTHATIPG